MSKLAKRSKLRLWLISVIIISGTALGVTWAVQTTSDAVVASLEIQVADDSIRKPIENVAAIEIGERISELNLTAAAARISSLPQVRTASVTRRWPDRIVISVDLRQPIGWLRFQDEIWYLDETGEKYQPQVAKPRTGLPEFVSGSDKLLLAATTAFFDLPKKLAGKVDRVTAATSSNIRFILTSDVTIIWGSAERGERKSEVLQVLLQRKAKTYDVSAPDLPTIRLN
jgi:cell division protein FtsQ